MAASSSSLPTRLFCSRPKAAKVWARPPSARVTMSGPSANAASVPICSASTMGS